MDAKGLFARPTGTESGLICRFYIYYFSRSGPMRQLYRGQIRNNARMWYRGTAGYRGQMVGLFRAGCMPDVDTRLPLFTSVPVTWSAGRVVIGSDGGTPVTHGQVRAGGAGAALLNYRFRLGSNVKGGAYRWGLANFVRPL